MTEVVANNPITADMVAELITKLDTEKELSHELTTTL